MHSKFRSLGAPFSGRRDGGDPLGIALGTWQAMQTREKFLGGFGFHCTLEPKEVEKKSQGVEHLLPHSLVLFPLSVPQAQVPGHSPLGPEEGS